METLKLISVRLDRNTLEAVDKLARQLGIMKRSWIINNLLNICVNCTTPGDLWRMASTFEAHKKAYKLTFKLDPDSIHNPHKTDY